MGSLAGLGACRLAYGDNAERRCAWCGDRLPPRRRRWCSDTCGRAFGDNHAWGSARRAAVERDGYRCTECGAPYPLEVHHVAPVGTYGYAAGCHHHLDGLITLCRAHHLYADRELRVRALVEWADARVSTVEQLRLAFAA